ncbi:MAG: hypothetical protein EOP85_04240 [Verrucomicrobiaceae bacterium]|nr:MAG: hypothetical protein EOP85_04240 [Verrucomicrobiaceae bacterium]
MSSFSLSIMSVVWPILALLLGAMQITASIILLKEKGPGPLMMLVGSVVSVLGSIALPLLSFLMNYLNADFNEPAYMAIWSLSILGSLIFSIGLLLFALRRRAMTVRIAELEAIITSKGDN